jgi:hypothetical protein
MKKVFSVVKYIDKCRAQRFEDWFIDSCLSSWALKCHGLTSEEMAKFYVESDDSWMIEVEDDEEDYNEKSI